MADEREIMASRMAKALARTVINHRAELDSLLADYGYTTTELSDSDLIDFIGQKMREREGLAEAIYSLMRVKLTAKYKNIGGDFLGGLLGGVGGIMAGIQGLIDATSDSGKKVRETQAQAALEAARAEQAKANAMLAAASKKSNTPLIIGIVGGVGLVGLGLFLYFKYGRKKAATAA